MNIFIVMTIEGEMLITGNIVETIAAVCTQWM